MATTTGLMTVEEARQIPETGSFYYELHHGQLVQVMRPKFKHLLIQRQLRRLLESVAGDSGMVETELPFRALPQYEFRVADVAYVTAERWRGIDLNDNLRGVPEIVIEVLSPSNTASEIHDKEALCLENGGREFWVVNPDLRQVKVSTPDGLTRTYQAGGKIPLNVLGPGLELDVDAIFVGIA